MKKLKKIEDLQASGASANLGTVRGQALLADSVKRYGLGRGICVDRNGVVIAGEKLLEAAKQAGITKIRVVTSSGDKLVAVKRRDLRMGDGTKARELAVLDNRAGQLNIFWDESMLAQLGNELTLKELGFRSSPFSVAVEKQRDTTKPLNTRVDLGGEYRFKIEYQKFVAWKKLLHDAVGWVEDEIVTEIRRRLGL